MDPDPGGRPFPRGAWARHAEWAAFSSLPAPRYRTHYPLQCWGSLTLWCGSVPGTSDKWIRIHSAVTLRMRKKIFFIFIFFKKKGRIRNRIRIRTSDKRIRIREAAHLRVVRGIRCLFNPQIRDPGWVKNQDPGSGSGMNRIIFPGA